MKKLSEIISDSHALELGLAENGMRHKFYKMYTSMDSALSFLLTGYMYLSDGQKWNDKADRDIMKCSHAFARCFSCSTVESIAMWMLYSGDKGKNGAMLSFPNAMMHELVNSAEIELGSFVNKQFVCSKVLTRENGDYSIILSDVVYTDDNKDGKTTTLTLWEDHENVDKSILNSQAVFHKNYAWAYEKECRLIVHLSAGMEQLAAENGLNRVRIILPRRYLNILRKKYFVRSPVYEGYVDIGRPSELAGKVEWDL